MIEVPGGVLSSKNLPISTAKLLNTSDAVCPSGCNPESPNGAIKIVTLLYTSEMEFAFATLGT